jgi:hypothetical protein
MKKSVLLFFALFLCGNSALAQNKTAVQSKKPQIVTDYFLLLPQKYIGMTPQARKVLIEAPNGATVDVKGGYMAFQEEPKTQNVIVLFKKPDGSQLIGVTRTKPSATKKAGGDADEECELYLLRYDGAQFVDVTKEVIPAPVDKKLSYDMSRQGTLIRVENGDGDLVHTFIWENGKFTLKR